MTGIARDLNVSTMTIYRRLKRENINLDDLRDKNGEISAHGASVIASLFDATGEQDAQTSETPADNVSQAVEIAVLRERVTALSDRLAAVCDERDRLREQVDRLTGLLEAEQRQRQQLLTDGNQQRRGLFAWLRRR